MSKLRKKCLETCESFQGVNKERVVDYIENFLKKLIRPKMLRKGLAEIYKNSLLKQ